jgi:hypothetical protein
MTRTSWFIMSSAAIASAPDAAVELPSREPKRLLRLSMVRRTSDACDNSRHRRGYVHAIRGRKHADVERHEHRGEQRRRFSHHVGGRQRCGSVRAATLRGYSRGPTRQSLGR